MRSKLLLPALAAGLLTLAGCDIEELHGGARYNRDFHYSYPLAANGKLSVETFNGSIEVTGWDENTIDISGTKYARTEEAADNIRVAVDHSPNAVGIRVERATGWHSGEGARLVIKIPRTALLDRITSSNGSIRTIDGAGPARLKTSNGSITVTSLKGSLEAQTSNGKVVAELDNTSGPVRAETSNGSIELRLPERFDEEVRAHTSNGSITLRAPGELNARIAARTSNGKISTDHELRASGEISKHRMEGVIGAGGPLFDLSTSNGSIHITR